MLHGKPRGDQDWSAERQKALLHERFADVGWQAPCLLAGMDATDDFYFDVLRQGRMKLWSREARSLRDPERPA